MKSVWKPPKENCVRLWARNNRGEILLTFVEEVAGIYRLRVPFEDLYTSVFLIRTEQGDALVDSGTYPSDVTEYILPALQEFGLRLADVRYLIFTHQHGDHTGGKTTLLALAPTIEVVQEKMTQDILKIAKSHSNIMKFLQMKKQLKRSKMNVAKVAVVVQIANVNSHRLSTINLDQSVKNVNTMQII